jgi:thioredoxin reductase (NADPH)
MEEIESIVFETGKNRVEFGDEVIEVKTIVICSGAEHKRLGLEKEESLTGKGISYCGLCDGNFFRDQIVACIGGGNTALEDALYLSGLAKKVYLIHRRDSFRGEKFYQDKVMAQPNIEILFDTVPERILGEEEVTGLEIMNVKTEEKRVLDVDGVFIFVGITPLTQFVPYSLERGEDGFLQTDTEMRTNMPGVFAAGDVRTKRCRQVATAVGDGAAAGHSAHLFLEELHDE